MGCNASTKAYCFFGDVMFSLVSTFLADLKNEDGYEISIPFEEPNADQTGFYNQNENMFDGKVFKSCKRRCI